MLSVPAQAHLQQDSRPEAAGSHNSWNGRSLHGAGQQEKEGREEQEPQDSKTSKAEKSRGLHIYSPNLPWLLTRGRRIASCNNQGHSTVNVILRSVLTGVGMSPVILLVLPFCILKHMNLRTNITIS